MAQSKVIERDYNDGRLSQTLLKLQGEALIEFSERALCEGKDRFEMKTEILKIREG